ncbi:unnamed protein product [Adineta steineri]|uniref:VCBS repeat-containing protein n=1 Tax=Adineta steineri TaxID=433720 RepID=A0A820EBB4_9BILA|nr:unnamed protein product [Adineta steineri]CAF4245995.1 unnamed protein product [Adineta steineri]
MHIQTPSVFFSTQATALSLLNTGNGTFSPQTNYSVDTSPELVAVADMNSDNKLDIAVANWKGNTVSVLLNADNGTFSSQTTYEVGPYPLSAAVADVNNDNKPDIVTANTNSNTVSVLIHC